METNHIASAPKWLLEREGVTQRQWRARKRRELFAIKKAVDTYRMGCAFTPNGQEICEKISRMVYDLRVSHSVKNWEGAE
jgi:hypothetical protein